MNVPNLPTDDFYKFLSLSGLFIFLLSVLYPIITVNDLEKDVSNTTIELKKLRLEISFLESRALKIQNRITETNKMLARYDLDDTVVQQIDLDALIDRLFDSEYREFLEFRYKYQDKIFPVFALNKKIELEVAEYESIAREIQMKSLDIKLKSELNGERVDAAKKTYLLWSIGQIFGGLISLFGFRNWYEKVQKPLDLKLEYEINALSESIEKEKNQDST